MLFLQGGATLQFAAVPMNLLRGKGKADYVITGEWSKKAIKEAKKLLRRRTSPPPPRTSNFTYAPKQSAGSVAPTPPTCTTARTRPSAASSSTAIPDTGDVPLVADASSHFLSRPIDVSKFGLIYAGAQKNIGPAGPDVRHRARRPASARRAKGTPTVLDYKVQAEADSMLNTPPTYAIYVAGLVFKWLKQLGGLAAIEKLNIAQGEAALRLSRLERVLPQPGGEGRPLAHEHAVHAARTTRWTRRS